MSYQFRPAIKTEAKPIIGLYSESGCGKTKSSLLLARGFAGPAGRVGMIETEAGRGEAYRDEIPNGYDVLSMREGFAPREYGDAISAAEKADLAALIIDSASHEWEGVGGVLHMAATNQAEGKKGPLIWQVPKIDHQRHFIGRLISTPIPLVIVCMRAKYPMKQIKNRPTVPGGYGGRVETGEEKSEWSRSEILEPKQSEDILFEMFVHGWIDREHKFHGTKYTLDELRHVILDGEVITLDTGRRLAEWARGGATSAVTQLPVPAVHAPASPGPTTQVPSPPGTQVPDERADLIAEVSERMQALGLKGADRLNLFSTYCGNRTSEAMKDCPLESLKALVDALKAQQAAA